MASCAQYVTHRELRDLQQTLLDRGQEQEAEAVGDLAEKKEQEDDEEREGIVLTLDAGLKAAGLGAAALVVGKYIRRRVHRSPTC